MGFTNQEKINFNSKILAAGVQDGVPSKQWYEGIRRHFVVQKANTMMTQFETVEANVAANLPAAQAAALANPTIIQDLSAPANAVRLTPELAANGFWYRAYATYNDFSSALLDKWIHPTAVPQSNGQPSIGYSIQLYDGDPNAGGTLINTSDGQTGSGNTASPGWIFYYDTGTLYLSEDFKNTVSDPYVVGFRYIGQTVQDGLGSNTNLQVDGGKLWVYDSTRNKWLSSDRLTVGAANKARTRNKYLEVFDSQTSNLSGYRLVRDATVTAIAAQTRGSESWTLRMRKNGDPTNIVSLTMSSVEGDHSNVVNVDLDEGDTIQFFAETPLGAIKDPLVWVEVAWRNDNL